MPLGYIVWKYREIRSSNFRVVRNVKYDTAKKLAHLVEYLRIY